MNRARTLAESVKTPEVKAVTMQYGDVTAIDDSDGKLMLTVDVEGGEVRCPMTTACKGVSVGDRVIVQTYGNLSTVTGVIAHDNSNYVKKTTLWEGSWSSGSITVPGASDYDLFGIQFSNADPNNWYCICAPTEMSDEGNRTMYPSFFGIVNSGGTVVNISAQINISEDTMSLNSKTQVIVSNSTDLYTISSRQDATRITSIDGYL